MLCGQRRCSHYWHVCGGSEDTPGGSMINKFTAISPAAKGRADVESSRRRRVWTTRHLSNSPLCNTLQQPQRLRATAACRPSPEEPGSRPTALLPASRAVARDLVNGRLSPALVIGRGSASCIPLLGWKHDHSCLARIRSRRAGQQNLGRSLKESHVSCLFAHFASMPALRGLCMNSKRYD